MSRPKDFFGADTKTVLNKPFFHAQDQKAYNVNGGTSIADAWTKRSLNTVISNDISGASLSNDEVSLPAGTYYIEAKAPQRWSGSVTSAIAAIFVGSTKVLQGPTQSLMYSSPHLVEVSGVITLSSPQIVQLRYYAGLALATDGLGASNNSGSITDASLPSIYSDLKIWQLDRSLEVAPVAVNSRLQTVPGLDTEGNVMGFDITKTGDSQLTISKGSCLDSTMIVSLAFTDNKILAVPSNLFNTVYHIFAVKLVAGGYEPRAYTSEAAVISDVQVSYFRWIGFWKTGSAGACYDGYSIASRVYFTGVRPVVTPSTTTSFVAYSLSAILPISRICSLTITAVAAGVKGTADVSLDGTTFYGSVVVEYSGPMSAWEIPPINSIYLSNRTTSTSVEVRSLEFRR